MGKKPEIKELSVGDAVALLAEPGTTFLDANPESRYRRGHIPGAVNVDPGAVADALPADRDARLVFYCRDTSCGAAPAAARRAARLGYGNVSVMPEGITGWEGAGQPVES
ncbi:MAG TPA: rhodanese-like domain-containing protein [Trebonia sp.]|nr:rhodanese-like domain-containing protein [Trebonia sp.]